MLDILRALQAALIVTPQRVAEAFVVGSLIIALLLMLMWMSSRR